MRISDCQHVVHRPSRFTENGKNGEKRSINGWKTVRIRSENGENRRVQSLTSAAIASLEIQIAKQRRIRRTENGNFQQFRFGLENYILDKPRINRLKLGGTNEKDSRK